MARLQDVLRRIITEMDDEEAKDEMRELRDQLKQGQKVSVADIREAIAAAPPEERAALRELLAEELNDDGNPPPADDGNGDDKGKGKRKPNPKPPATKRNVRPGRKSGAAYDWYVDDDGKVVRSPTAVIYSGEDEPDEVEMLPPEDDDNDDDGKGGDEE